ncbi:MAG: hypothetical protein JXR50_11230, partial [Prolixibacteraceae bacterium]|nr:hypothetical protein [Prolixibacteraceae bacterium]
MELVSITQIECDTVLVDDKLIDVNGICVSDDMVIFAHEKAEPLIQIFDRMNNKYIGGIGEKGKGANSGSIRTPIPETSGRPFWNDPDTRSGN